MTDHMLKLFELKKDCLTEAALNRPTEKQVGTQWVQLLKGVRVLYDYGQSRFTKMVWSENKQEKTLNL